VGETGIRPSEGTDGGRYASFGDDPLVCALVTGPSVTEARKLSSCLEFKDMSKPRLDCYDAIVPPQTKPEKVPTKVVSDCRFFER